MKHIFGDIFMLTIHSKKIQLILLLIVVMKAKVGHLQSRKIVQ